LGRPISQSEPTRLHRLCESRSAGTNSVAASAQGGYMSDLQRKPVTSADASSFEFEPLLDSEEAAALLKIHPKTLQRLARQGEVTAIQIGKLWRFRASALNRW